MSDADRKRARTARRYEEKDEAGKKRSDAAYKAWNTRRENAMKTGKNPYPRMTYSYSAWEDRDKPFPVGGAIIFAAFFLFMCFLALTGRG
jgi:hypothetical protein